ncbi:hypothetical protein EDP2_3931 [Enterobacter cloacae S611]|uniref:Secreted protein n=1 Tax=Enterobacter cloacae S611 TaxID=1399146 RepID=A0ABN0QC63_ENTCL|nr:hypothetical protein EDP2_3931 [Enterobacter cloacae S611]
MVKPFSSLMLAASCVNAHLPGRLVADLRQFCFGKPGHAHHRAAIEAVLQHRPCDAERLFFAPLLDTALLADLKAYCNTLLFKLLCNCHQLVLMLWRLVRRPDKRQRHRANKCQE